MISSRSNTDQKRKQLHENENNPFFMQQCFRIMNYSKALQTLATLAVIPGLIHWLANSICLEDLNQILAHALSKNSRLIPKVIVETNNAFRDALYSQPTEIIKDFFRFYAKLGILSGMEHLFECGKFRLWVRQETSAEELFELLVIIQNSNKKNTNLFYNLLKEQPAIYHHINQCPSEEQFRFLKQWLNRENNPVKISTVLSRITNRECLIALSINLEPNKESSHTLPHSAQDAKPKSSPLNAVGIFSFTQTMPILTPEHPVAVQGNKDPADALLLTPDDEFTTMAEQFSAAELRYLINNQ